MNATCQAKKIAFIGNHIPRKCGIATFTSDLLDAVAEAYPQSQCLAVAINDSGRTYPYPEVVRFEIEEQALSSYLRAADFLNISNVDVVCLQHEFGIFGGPAGAHILALLRELRMPVVTTLHTVLRDPTPDQRRVTESIASHSARLVVMAEHGREILEKTYKIPSSKIDVIPHGIHDVAFVDPTFFKDQFGVDGKFVLLTFGLLSPNKGIEHVLNALPEIVDAFPEVVYVVLGATHPNEQRENGESYRLGLELLAKKNNVDKNVIFFNQFVDMDTLKAFIGAADIYITPYLNEEQITSGTLSYAFGAGKAVVSTPYWHAAELLADDRGVLVPFGDARAISKAITDLLRDENRRHTIRKQAYKIGREMVWCRVAQRYMESFEAARADIAARSRKFLASRTLDQKVRELPDIRLGHLSRMTDPTGVFQHAKFSVPNFSEGYCTDDNARAFILATSLGEIGQHAEYAYNLSTVTLAFLFHAFDRERMRFHNHMSFDRQWLDETGSDDCQGRALWALGVGVGRSRVRSFQMMAGQLFLESLPLLQTLTSPRAWSFGLIGIHEYLQRLSGDSMVRQIRDDLANRLLELYRKVSRPDWRWFEDILTYDNAKIAHAMILSGQGTGQQEFLDCGLESLRWLMDLQTSDKGYFRPIGNDGFYPRGGECAHFDQQPIEAHATIAACLAAYRATSDSRWLEHSQRAFDWFIGWNDLGLALYSAETGGCYDGLHVDRVNQNQGAESTLAFLQSLIDMRSAQTLLTSFEARVAAEV